MDINKFFEKNHKHRREIRGVFYNFLQVVSLMANR